MFLSKINPMNRVRTPAVLRPSGKEDVGLPHPGGDRRHALLKRPVAYFEHAGVLSFSVLYSAAQAEFSERAELLVTI